jgi:hypothetical protein
MSLALRQKRVRAAWRLYRESDLRLADLASGFTAYR